MRPGSLTRILYSQKKNF